MRTMICLLLVLALCVGLGCTAFATVISPGHEGTAPTTPDSDVPETGDNADLGTWLLVMLAALVVLIAVTVCYFKFMKK